MMDKGWESCRCRWTERQTNGQPDVRSDIGDLGIRDDENLARSDVEVPVKAFERILKIAQVGLIRAD